MRFRVLSLALVLMGSLLIWRGFADDELVKPAKPQAAKKVADEKIPPGVTEYMGRKIAPTMSYAHAAWLTRRVRNREEEPAKLMKALNIKEGMTVCDLGCGNGFYTLKLAKEVGQGQGAGGRYSAGNARHARQARDKADVKNCSRFGNGG